MINSKTFRNTIYSIAGTCAFVFMALGSASGPRDLTNYTLVPIKSGTLENKDIRIVAEDGSFEIIGGKEFDVPFQSDIWGNAGGITGDKLVEKYDLALHRGAKKVRVYVAGKDKPLYGILALSPVYAAAYGPGARSYFLSLPNDKIKSASDGNISVMYEKVDWRRQISTGSTTDNYWFGWILWLSNNPLR